MLGVKPEECVFVDDLKSNCDAAEAVGMTSVLVRALSLLTVDRESSQVRPGKSNDAVQELVRLLHLTPASRSSSQLQLNGHTDPLSSLSTMLNGYVKRCPTLNAVQDRALLCLVSGDKMDWIT